MYRYYLYIYLIVENEAHVYTKETFYHWIPELNTVAHLLTDSVGGPPAWKEDCRTDAPRAGWVPREGEQVLSPTHLPNSPLILSQFCLGVKTGHECYAWSFNMEIAILNRRKLISLLTTYNKTKG